MNVRRGSDPRRRAERAPGGSVLWYAGHAAMSLPLAMPLGRHPVALALRSLIVLGVACTLFGAVFVIAFGVLNSFHRFRLFFAAMGLLLWLAPGVSYLCCAALMRRHHQGAATAAFATTLVQAVGAAALLTASATFDPVTPLPVLLCGMWLLALADCMRHLLRARRFLASGTERARGFEPLVAAKPVLPVSERR
jgi:hypothetical protein